LLKLPCQDGDLIGIPGDNGVRSLSSVLIETLLGLLSVAKGVTGDGNGVSFFRRVSSSLIFLTPLRSAPTHPALQIAICSGSGIGPEKSYGRGAEIRGNPHPFDLAAECPSENSVSSFVDGSSATGMGIAAHRSDS
jgi:hypothetical protein